MTHRVLLACALLIVACSPMHVAVVSAPSSSLALATGFRVVTPANGAESNGSDLIDRATRANVVFFGEQHDDPETHRAEAELLDAIGRSGRPVVLSLEMFERDVQGVLDDYLADRVSEQDFLAKSRPWERYATDYRRLVELAKAQHWRVIAANVPRPLASAVGRKGLAALDTLTVEQRKNAARDNVCPADDYRARFLESMQSHPGAGASAGDTLPTATAERFYVAQCVKDETMAESIVNARLAGGSNAIVVHFNGAFHSEYSQGTVARVKRRQPGWTIATVTAVPVANPSIAPVATQSGKADFVIFTKQPPHR